METAHSFRDRARSPSNALAPGALCSLDHGALRVRGSGVPTSRAVGIGAPRSQVLDASRRRILEIAVSQNAGQEPLQDRNMKGPC